MEIRYVRSIWGMEEPTTAESLRRIKAGGFDGVELGVPADAGERRELGAVLRDLELDLVVQQWTVGDTPAEHADSYETQFRRAVELGPLLVNSHTGRDVFGLEDNAAIFRRSHELEAETGVTALHETHRQRALFATTTTEALLDAVPELRLTADYSHWCCVHESLLADQPERVGRAIERSRHIHARVGHPGGPQIPDPRAPEWAEAVDTHLDWWQRIVDRNADLGTGVLTICPEFGPFPYMPTQPFTRQPVVDLWATNIYVRELLKERLRIP